MSSTGASDPLAITAPVFISFCHTYAPSSARTGPRRASTYGASDVACKAGSVEFSQLEAGLVAVAQELAQLIVRDGEGATKFIRIAVEKAASVAEARTVAYSVAHSPLVKTAFFASDPNLGRILAAIGYAQVDGLDVNAIDVYLDDIHVATAGGRQDQDTAHP